MRLLLDTHTFLWFVQGSPSLSPETLRVLMDGRNERLLSLASVWEMAIKIKSGKLTVAQPFRTFISEQMARHKIELLVIEHDHLDLLFCSS